MCPWVCCRTSSPGFQVNGSRLHASLSPSDILHFHSRMHDPTNICLLTIHGAWLRCTDDEEKDRSAVRAVCGQWRGCSDGMLQSLHLYDFRGHMLHVTFLVAFGFYISKPTTQSAISALHPSYHLLNRSMVDCSVLASPTKLDLSPAAASGALSVTAFCSLIQICQSCAACRSTDGAGD